MNFIRWILMFPVAFFWSCAYGGFVGGVGQYLLGQWKFTSGFICLFTMAAMVIGWMQAGMYIAPIKNKLTRNILVTPLILMALGWIFILFDTVFLGGAINTDDLMSPSLSPKWEVVIMGIGLIVYTGYAVTEPIDEFISES